MAAAASRHAEGSAARHRVTPARLCPSAPAGRGRASLPRPAPGGGGTKGPLRRDPHPPPSPRGGSRDMSPVAAGTAGPGLRHAVRPLVWLQ